MVVGPSPTTISTFKILLFEGLYHKTQLLCARNFRQSADFQFEVFTVPESICLPDQPSDFIAESFHTGIADMQKNRKTDIPKRLDHRS